MIITAAPYLFICFASQINFSSPSFNDIEFTIHLPCTTCKPASIISHLELSTIIGTLHISGSAAIRFKKRIIDSFPSIKPSSKLMSIICAPPSTWCLAISKASSNFSSLINLKNFLEPATLVRSPTLMKLLFSFKTKGSKPDNCMYFDCFTFII